jgi:cellulose synthase operon protein YhjU
MPRRATIRHHAVSVDMDTGTAPAIPTPPPPTMRLGAWNIYFVAKFVLMWRELIGLHALENIAFAALLLMPVTSNIGRRIRLTIAIPVAIALLYYDSWLPPISRVLSQATQLSALSPSYLLELIGRFVNWPVVALLILAIAVCRIVDRYIRVGFLVVAALLVLTLTDSRRLTAPSGAEGRQLADVPTASGGNPDNLDNVLQAFYAQEAKRNVNFPNAESSVPFDIIFIHICSLSWDDLQSLGMDQAPFWSGFDFLFHHFNSAASYSGPAAIRINRAICGQTSHQALYTPVSDQCLLMPSLKKSGFETNFAMNHDGHFDNFLTLVRQQGVAAPLVPFDGLTAPLHGFDNSPIYDDLDILSRWFDARQALEIPRVALFYNTITLHDGNRYVSGTTSTMASADSYKMRLQKLFSDLDEFMAKISKSGRRALVVVVPEHGAAQRGDKFQIAGLREIATPAITTVPVGVKLIGPDATRHGAPAQIDAQISYLGLSQLIANLIAVSPYGSNGFATADYVADLPTTAYVAQNEGAAIIQHDSKFYLKLDKEAWQEYH